MIKPCFGEELKRGFKCLEKVTNLFLGTFLGT